MFTLQSGSGWAWLAFTGAMPSRMASAHTPASTAPAAAIRWPMQLFVELTATRSMWLPITARNGGAFAAVVHQRGSAVGIHVIHVLRRQPGVAQRLLHGLNRAVAGRMANP